MSALGQKQTYALHKGMSALPPIATCESGLPQKVMSALPRTSVGDIRNSVGNGVGKVGQFSRSRSLHEIVPQALGYLQLDFGRRGLRKETFRRSPLVSCCHGSPPAYSSYAFTMTARHHMCFTVATLASLQVGSGRQ